MTTEGLVLISIFYVLISILAMILTLALCHQTVSYCRRNITAFIHDMAANDQPNNRIENTMLYQPTRYQQEAIITQALPSDTLESQIPPECTELIQIMNESQSSKHHSLSPAHPV